MVQEGYEQDQRQGHGQGWVHQGEQDSANLYADRHARREQAEEEFTDVFPEESDGRDQVIEIV